MCLIFGCFIFVIWAATLFFGAYVGYRMRVEDEYEGKPPYEFGYVKEISAKKDVPEK